MCDFLHFILVQYDLGLEKQAREHGWTFLAVYGSFMAILAEFGHLAAFGGQYIYLAEFVTFVLNMLQT